MRIGIDCRLWEQTGVGRYTRNLVLNLQKIDKKNQYVIFARKEDFPTLKSQISNPKWRVVEADIRWHSVLEQFKFPLLIKKQKLDLMHFPYFSVPILYDKPYIVTIHDLIINHFSTGRASTLFYPFYLAKREAYKFVIRKAAQNAKKIIVPSNATKREIIEHFKIAENKIETIYEATDARIKNYESRIKNEEFGRYFLYVGNAYPHKNLERLIAAFNKLSADSPDLKLIFVGQKDYFYQRLERENKSKELIFLGKVSDERLAKLYSSTVCVVVPSLMEGFGLPVFEAMSLRCLVLCSDIPAFREIAADNAIYFNPLDENDIYLKLKDVLRNEKEYRQEKVEKAYQKSLQFSWEKAAEQTLNVYESSLSL